MDDTRLDREIETLLSIDPAPDFRARVRERIASEPPMGALGAAAWRVSWAVAGGGALVAGALIATLVLRTTPEPRPATELTARTIDQAGYHTPAQPVASERASNLVSGGETRRRPPAVPIEQATEVIIYLPEAAAWRKLLAGVRTGQVDLSRMARADDAPAPLSFSDEFVLPPVVIEPLTPGFREQGVHP